MKKLFSFLTFTFLLLNFEFTSAQNIGIGTITPDSTAVLELQSTTSGFLPPRMTYSQRNTIVNPAVGLIVYCTNCGNGEMQFYNGTAWMQMTVAVGSVPYVAPTLETATISSITTTSAVSGGNITANGGATVTARGVCWSTSANPTVTLSTKTVDGAGNGTFTSSITGLTANTTYYVRAYATNSLGTSYGTQVSFTTSNYSFVNLPSVTIGTQIWTTKNLDVAKYRNGDPIPQVTDATQWANLTTGAWCWYNNDSATYAATYGRLYNWYAVNDPRGIAPQGWHVPTNRESDLMTIYLDPTVDTTTIGLSGTNIGRQLKNTTGWNSGGNGTNSSGFAFLPGGARYNNGAFFSVGDFGYWWSASEFDTTFVWYRGLYNDINNSLVNRYYCNKVFGFSIRLVRD
jgi:uncharacterized protein (TIGR02145 family)